METPSSVEGLNFTKHHDFWKVALNPWTFIHQATVNLGVSHKIFSVNPANGDHDYGNKTKALFGKQLKLG